VSFADVIGQKQTLVNYSHMFGPQRERLCPMCGLSLTHGMVRRATSSSASR
jgi:predicted dithiol-disulfide oxidoreductase (DUF899 family)